ncbi:hypothetical protein GGF37_001546 [Kickxella alabastrina]|nr:hypothetical protein GGF37_001546 [Kickxella alabastrina]
MTTSLEYASDSPTHSLGDTFQQQHAQLQLQQQPSQPDAAARPNGLLGKMFRKSTSKHPKLNPVGISSKQFFGEEPRPVVMHLSPTEYHAPPKGVKLTRKLSAISPTISNVSSNSHPLFAMQGAGSHIFQTMNGQSYTAQQHWLELSLPRIGDKAAEGDKPASNPAYQTQCYRPSRLKLDVAHGVATAVLDKDISKSPVHQTASAAPSPGGPNKLLLSPGSPFGTQPQMQSTPTSPMHAPAVPQSELLAMYNEAERAISTGERKQRGSPWSAKLGFTNIRRPETRTQRHQAFDINSVDIATHPCIYPEPPLVSVPSIAPVSARGNNASGTATPFSALDTLVGTAADSTSLPQDGFDNNDDSPLYANSEVIASVGNLGSIDKEFLLTIQRNSALEARRQRRRETRRNTVSVLSTSDRDSNADKEHLSSMPPALVSSFAARKNISAFLAPTDSGHDMMPHGITIEHLSRLSQIGEPLPYPDTALRLADMAPRPAGRKLNQSQGQQQQKTPAPKHELDFTTAPQKDNILSQPALDITTEKPEFSSPSTYTSVFCSPKNPRPLSSDSLTYAEQQVTSSADDIGSNSGESDAWSAHRPSTPNMLSQRALASGPDGATGNNYTSPATFASSPILDSPIAKLPKLSALLSAASPTHSVTTLTPHSPALASTLPPYCASNSSSVISNMQFSTSVTFSSLNKYAADGSIPLVPYLPHGTAAQTSRYEAMVSIPLPAVATRPGTANPHASPRIVSNNRRYRGSTLVGPSASMAADTENFAYALPPLPSTVAAIISPPPLRQPASQIHVAQSNSGWDADSIRMQRYRLTPASGRQHVGMDVDCLPESPVHPDTESDDILATSTKAAEQQESATSQPLHKAFVRKFSHPDTQLHLTSRAPMSPTRSPDTLSKSVSNLSTTSHKSVSNSNDDSGNVSSCYKNGISRLFSVNPSNRKLHLTKNKAVNSQPPSGSETSGNNLVRTQAQPQQQSQPVSPAVTSLVDDPLARRKIRDQLASSTAFDRLLEEDDEFTMAISLTPLVAGTSRKKPV